METIFITYFWAVPVILIIAIILNRILGYYITTINQATLYSAPFKGSESADPTNLGFILHIIIFFPITIFVWWVFTRLLNFDGVFIFFAGYLLLLWITAIIRQISSIVLHFQFKVFKYNAVFTKDELIKAKNLNNIGAVSDYFSYFLIYLLTSILTQSWFIAGGVLVCLFAIGRHLLNAQKIASTQSKFA